MINQKIMNIQSSIRQRAYILTLAIAGAQILVNTVGYIKGQLHLTDKHYGHVMATFGISAAHSRFASGNLINQKTGFHL